MARYYTNEPNAVDRRTNALDDGHGPIGLREGTLGAVGLFAIFGLALGLLAFGAAFGLDRAAEEAQQNDGTADDPSAIAAGLPAVLVSLLPLLAAIPLALGAGSWAGHGSRSGRVGAIAGAVGGFVGPILALLLTGIGFALGAGATGLNLEGVQMPGNLGFSPTWNDTLPYLFSGAGLLYLLSTTLAGALSGGLIGGLMDRWLDRRAEMRYQRYDRRPMAPRI